MIRGLQKQMIYLATPKSRHFELVCFVLRPERCHERVGDAEMLREARALLAGAEPKPKDESAKTLKKRKLWLFFFGGFLSGCLGTALVAFLIAAR